MCSCLFIFSNGYQLFLFFSTSSLSSSPSHLHILHNSSLFSLYKNLSSLLLFFTFWLPHPFKLSYFPILSLSLIILSNGTQGQEILLCPIYWCLSCHSLEWSLEVGGTSTIDIPAREPHPHGESISFSFFFLIFKFFSYLWFECVFGYLSARVFLWDGFKWKLDALMVGQECIDPLWWFS